MHFLHTIHSSGVRFIAVEQKQQQQKPDKNPCPRGWCHGNL